MLSRGSPTLQSKGQNQKWPTSGLFGHITPTNSGVPTTSKWGIKSQVAQRWAGWLHHPCRLRGPHRFRARDKITSGPQVGLVATSPSEGSLALQSQGQNQKSPECPGAFVECSEAFVECSEAFPVCLGTCVECPGAFPVSFGAFVECPGPFPFASGHFEPQTAAVMWLIRPHVGHF